MSGLRNLLFLTYALTLTNCADSRTTGQKIAQDWELISFSCNGTAQTLKPLSLSLRETSGTYTEVNDTCNLVQEFEVAYPTESRVTFYYPDPPECFPENCDSRCSDSDPPKQERFQIDLTLTANEDPDKREIVGLSLTTLDLDRGFVTTCPELEDDGDETTEDEDPYAKLYLEPK